MNSDPNTPATTSKLKITVWAILAAVVVGSVVAFAIARTTDTTNSNDSDSTTASNSDQSTSQLIRENSRVLSKAPQENAVLVEFLDFECEACAAAYPFVEDLRDQYGDNVTFVQRYFPLPGHPNSMNAAIAVEAAAQQGSYEPMYQQMFETQTEWSHTTQDRSPVFRGYAEELGLDMAAYDAAVADPATQERIEADIADGQALGVQGTPTFFLDGQPITAQSLDEFRADVEDAAAN